MDQKQIHVPESNLFHAGTRAGQRRVDAVVDGVHDLCGDVDVLARHAAVANGLSNLELVGIELGRVDVTVAELEGGAAGGDADLCGGEVDAKANARDGEV